MSKIVKIISRKPILGNDLMERWSGMSPSVFADMIDAKNANDINKKPDKITLDFPNVYRLVDELVRNPETQKIHTKCESCKPNYQNEEKYKRPYRIMTNGLYDFSELIFKRSEVKAFEELHPEVFWERVEPTDTPLARNSKQKKDIRKLQHRIKELEAENLILKDNIVGLQSKLNVFVPPSPEESIKSDIDKWTKYINSLDERDKKGKKGRAAKMAILKLNAESHKDVFFAIYGAETGKSDNVIGRTVNSHKETAEEIAREYELTMPVWDTRNARK